MDAQPDQPAASPRGAGGRGTSPKGAAPGRRPAAAAAARTPSTAAGKKPAPVVKKPAPAAKKPAPAVKKAAPSAPAEPAAPESAASRILRGSGPSRSTARRGTVGARRPPAVVEEPVVEEPVADEPVVEPEPEPIVEEPVVEPEPEPEPEPEQVAEPEPVFEPEPEPAAPPAVLLPRAAASDLAIALRGLTKRFGATIAVDRVDLDVPAGSFYGFVGPNGAGKTTTLSMITGLLRPDAGTVLVHGADMWADAAAAKRAVGVLPDRLRLFDRLTGAEYLHHAGALRGLDRATVARRSADLIQGFGLESASRRFVSDFSAGMVKKIAIAAAMIHSPRVLVLDEPFESVDPVSAQLVIEVLQRYTEAGGTVLLSSHSMDLIERVCDSVAIIADGHLLAAGTLAQVLGGATLENRFVELAGGATAVEGMEWLQSFSD